MKFGCFGFIKHIPLIESAGYDEAELDIGEINALSEHEFSELVKKCQDSRLLFSVYSGCLPLTINFHSPDFDKDYWIEYLRKAAWRTARLGATIWPFGAGKCRSIPEDSPDPRMAREWVRQIVEEICGVLDPYGITLSIEPLGPANSNYLNYLSEAVDFVGNVQADNCKIMCDLRHMYKLDDDFANIKRYIDLIAHAHIDYPKGDKRYFPKEGDDYDYRPYLAALIDADYQAILSIEATSYRDYGEDASQSLVYIRSLLDRERFDGGKKNGS